MEKIPHYYKHAYKLIECVDKLMTDALEGNPNPHALKAAELKWKIHKSLYQTLDPKQQLLEMEYDEVPLECLQKWQEGFQESVNRSQVSGSSN